ncbi:MAG: hypothetical protein QXT42_06765, partial [Thermoplasmata archaeon]
LAVALAARLAGAGEIPPGEAPEEEDPLDALQSVIQQLHSVIGLLPDAMHTQMAVQALSILVRIQRDLMQGGERGGSQAPAG